MTSAGIGERGHLLASGSWWASLQRPSGEGGRGSGGARHLPSAPCSRPSAPRGSKGPETTVEERTY